MLRWIVSGSMAFRLLIIAAAAAVIAIGAVRLPSATKDVLPEFSPPHVEVQTEALGLSAAEVESLVTVNLEELLNGTPWLDTIRSTSIPGLSSVVLTFEPGTDVARARQLVAERLTLAYALPNVSRPPVILQPLSSSSRVLMVSLASGSVSPIQMSVLTRWTIRPALLAVPGVANVTVWGYRDRQLQVQVDPKRLARDGIPLDQIVRTAGNAMWVSPLTYLEASTPGSGGWIETPQQRLEVRHVFPISGAGGLARVRVEDLTRRLGTVARVVEDHPPLIGDAVLRNRTPGLLLVVEKLPGADTQEVTSGVEDALTRLGAGLRGIRTDTTVFRPATYVSSSIDHLTLTMLIGALLVLAVLLAFLYRWRAVLISVISIAVAFAAAALLVDVFGYTLNAMVIAGLVIALAVVVDEAIIGVENVMRRLSERRAAGEPGSPMAAILEGTLQMRRVAIFATLVILLPLLPVFFMTGVSASLFEPLAVTYTLAVAAAVVVALTVTPALCAMLLPSEGGHRESPVAPWLRRVYSAALERVMRRPTPAFAVALAAIAAGAAVIPFLGREQVPAFKDPNLVVALRAAAGTSQPEVARITARLARELGSLPGVAGVGGEVGRAVLGDQVVDVNSSALFVRMDPDADYDTTLARVRSVVDGYPGLARGVDTYEAQSLDRAETDATDPIEVKVFGPRFDVLAAKAEEVRRAVSGIDGIRAVHMERTVQQPHVQITVRLEQAQRYGLKPGDVRREAATLLAGLSVGSLFEEQKVFDVAVWSTPRTRQSLSDIQDLLLDTPSGGHVPLGTVAQVKITPSPTLIHREAVSRRVRIGLAVSGDAGSVAGQVRARLAAINWPLEYHAELSGDAVEGHGARDRMIAAGVVAGLLAFLLLQAAFRSWRLAAAFFLALPLALVGGLLAAFVADDPITLGSILAFLAVLAIAARNGMVLIDRYRQLERDEGVPFGLDLVLRGARERVVPIIATALAVGLAMLVFAIRGVVAGQELINPIAVIVLGGVFTATALSLFVIPPLYLRFGARAARPEAYDLDPDAPDPPTPLKAS